MSMYRCLRGIPSCIPRWPGATKMAEYAKRVKAKEPLIPGCIGFIDGTHVPLQSSSDHRTQNANYNAWTASTSISNVLVFSPEGTIIWAAVNFPGSWHDAAVSRALGGMTVDSFIDR
jgi:hypothetical protein